MTKLMVVDGNSLAYRAYYGIPPLSTSEGVPTQAVLGFINMLNTAIQRIEPDHLAVAFDVGSKVFRHDAFPDYKANRKPMPQDLRSQMALIREALSHMNIVMLGLEGYEADDLIGTLVTWANKQGYQSTIVSGDQDTFQLIDENTRVMYPRKGLSDPELIDLVRLQEEYDLAPEQIIELKGLMGDSADNIPGIPGVGPKTAKKFLKEYGSMENLYDHLDDFKGKKMGERLEEHRDIAFLSKELATINRQVPLPIDEHSIRRQSPDVQGLLDFYHRYELRRLAENFKANHPEASDFRENESCEEQCGHEVKSLDDLEDILRNMPGDKCVLFGRTENEQELLYFRSQGKNYRIDLPHLGEALRTLDQHYFSKKNTLILTDDAKAFCRLLYQYELDADKLAWDAVLADYLLFPEGKEHGLDRMIYDYFTVPLPEKRVERAFAELYWIERLQPLVTLELEKQGLNDLYSSLELPLAAVLADMELFGVRLDMPYLKDLQGEFESRIEEIQETIFDLAGEKFNTNSPKQLSHILFEVLDLTPIKKTKTGYSTNAEVLDKLKDDHPIIPAILDYRELAKLQSTYVNGLLDLAVDGRVHTSFNQTVTATGRLSSTAPNLQNIPVRTDEGRRIRQAILPSEEGRILISADYSQIELRVLAHMSQDEGLLQSFREQEDIHRRTASEVFHVPIDAVTADQRRTAKAVNFGIIYGQTDYGLSQELGISRPEAQRYIDTYFERYPLVREFIDDTIAFARQEGYVSTLLGRRRTIRDIHSTNFNLRHFAERTAVNAPIQGSAADIIKLAMLKCDELLRDQDFQARMILQVHDELVFDAPPEEVGYLIKHVTAAMENAMTLSIPLKVDLAVGFNWNEMEDVQASS